MTIVERGEAFREAFPRRKASWPWVAQEKGEPVLYAVWVMGADYRRTAKLYGAYPRGYLARVRAFFPEVPQQHELHVFSGSLRAGAYTRCDLRRKAELQCSVYDLPDAVGRRRWPLVMADPPYSAADAAKYGTPMIVRGRAMRAIAQVVKPRGFVAWLDTTWPMHSKDEFRTAARIFVQRSTNHRIRTLTLFERR